MQLIAICSLLMAMCSCIVHDVPKSQLCVAAVDGNVDQVRKLILSGEGVNEPDANGLTPLAWAARGRGAAVVPVLVKAGADINQRVRGWTPLMHAIDFHNISVGLALLDNGAEINARAENGYTALMLATELATELPRGDFVSLLLDRGADPSITAPDGSDALTMAVASGSPHASGLGCETNIVRLLISRYPNLSVPNTAWGKRSLQRAREMHCDEVLSMVHERAPQ